MGENKVEIKPKTNYFLKGLLFALSIISYVPIFTSYSFHVGFSKLSHEYLAWFIFFIFIVVFLYYIYNKKIAINKNNNALLILYKIFEKYYKKIFWLGIGLSSTFTLIINPIVITRRGFIADFANGHFSLNLQAGSSGSISGSSNIGMLIAIILIFILSKKKLNDINPENNN